MEVRPVPIMYASIISTYLDMWHNASKKWKPSITEWPKKTQITVVGCVSARGYCLPPMVIWDRKRLRPELTV